MLKRLDFILFGNFFQNYRWIKYVIDFFLQLHNVSRLLRNQRGLLFTSQTETEVLDFFNDHNESDFLRTGGIAGK